MVWLLIFILNLIFTRPVYAEGEFVTAYDVNYVVSETGKTRTSIKVNLTNRLSNIYASEFTLSIGSTNLTNIELSGANGSIEPQVSVGNKTTNINIIFNDKVLGKDQGQEFTLEFDSTDFATRLGNVWEISIPRLAKSDSLDSYNLSLSIPQSFGQAATMTPRPNRTSVSGNNTVYQFSNESLYQSGISATFGKMQFFDFNLTYNLANPNFYPINTEIALPPDTLWQQVVYASLEPKPQNIRLDGDGNWLASYQLLPSANLKVVATGSATLYLSPREDYPYSLNPAINYLKPSQYWEADQPRLKALSQELGTPRKIYDYLVNNLIYDYGRLGESVTRLGAANALDNQDSALCMEFTDLFVALSRAAGIKARAVNGFAYTDNPNLRPLSLQQDVLHAWPEYYDSEKNQWRPVDPTWGNTTGGVDYFEQPGLNHFAFVMLGESSTYPIPAGAYKIDLQPEKNVSVEFGQSIRPQPNLTIDIVIPEKNLSGISLTGKIVVTNTGNVAQYQLPVKLQAQKFKLTENNWEIDALPPFSRSEIEFILPPTSWTNRFSDRLTVTVPGSEVYRDLEVSPVYQVALHPRLLLGGLSLILSLFMLKLIYGRIIKARRHH